MKNLLIVDDHTFTRNALVSLFTDSEYIKVLGTCSDGDEVIPFLEKYQVNIILMDIKMKRLNGVDTTRLVKENFPEVKVIGFSLCNSKYTKNEIIEAGADGFLCKELDSEILVKELLKISHLPKKENISENTTKRR